MIKSAFFWLLFSCLVYLPSVYAIEIKHVQARKGSLLDQYAIELINFLINVSGEKASFIPISDVGSQTRRQLMMKQGSFDVDWFAATPQVETIVVPIRYPILRGLLGHRIFITNKETSAFLNSDIPFNDLKKLNVVQGQGWGDVLILESGGFTHINTLADFNALFKMIESNRSSLFPRSIIEPYGELADRCNLDEKYVCTDKNLMIDDKLLLIYKLPMFIFVSPKRQDLINLFNSAFENHYDEFLIFFNNHPLIKDTLKKLKNRSIYQIKTNELLSHETINIPDRYWMETFSSKH